MTRGLRCARWVGSFALVLLAACDAAPANVLWEVHVITPGDAQVETPSRDAGAPLQTRIQVNGANTVCGTCSVLVAQTEGGARPYTYVWSDPALVGPGPHTVCPNAPTTYSVAVTDSSAIPNGELQRSARVAKATGTVNCVNVPSDGGAPLDSSSLSQGSGCFGPAIVELPVVCQSNTLGISTEVSNTLPKALAAGSTYQVNFDNTLPFQLNAGAIADIFGANEPCVPQELLGTFTVDGTTTHQSFCFSAKRDYQYFVSRARTESNLLGLTGISAASFCAGCSGN